MIEKKIANGDEIKIICAGDSHTYGEGASDCFKGFTPNVAAGDLRKPNLSSPSYVNLVANYLNERTDSQCTEIYYNSRYLKSDISYNSDGSVSPLFQGRVEMSAKAGSILLQMKCGENFGHANIYIDNELIECIDTSLKLIEGNDYNIYWFTGLQDKTHIITIENNEDENSNDEIKPIYFFKLEAYSGQCITINSGIGSCDSSKYLNSFFDRYVIGYRPDYLILEAFSVNDWLASTPIDIYKKNLIDMISTAKNHGCKVVLLTVSPLLRARYPYNKINVHYDEYIAGSRKAAMSTNIKIADANLKMQKAMRILKSYENLMHVNNAHVNDIGHLIYFSSILDALNLTL